MKKILCATDDTEVSRKAEVYATQLAKSLNAELWYVYVSPIAKQDLKIPEAWDVTILEEIAAREHDVLRHAEKIACDNGLCEARCVILRSHKVVSAIVGFAEKEGFDHIVTGSTGRVGIPRFMLGSVAGGIIHKAHCPVTVVR